MSIVRQCNVIVEGLSFANFIAEFYSGGVAVRAVFSYGVAYDRELEEYVFCALVFNGTVYTFQFGYETFVYAIYNDAFFQLLLPCLSPLRPIYSKMLAITYI